MSKTHGKRYAYKFNFQGLAQAIQTTNSSDKYSYSYAQVLRIRIGAGIFNYSNSPLVFRLQPKLPSYAESVGVYTNGLADETCNFTTESTSDGFSTMGGSYIEQGSPQSTLWQNNPASANQLTSSESQGYPVYTKPRQITNYEGNMDSHAGTANCYQRPTAYGNTDFTLPNSQIWGQINVVPENKLSYPGSGLYTNTDLRSSWDVSNTYFG